MRKNFSEIHLGMSRRQELLRIGHDLKNTYLYYRQMHRDIADFILPARSQFLAENTNKGPMRLNKKILDSTATQAVRTLKAGMLSGITSPARKWFNLTTPIPELKEYANVKRWLNYVGNDISDVLLKTNFYNQIQSFYGDLGTFGVAALFVEEKLNGKVASFKALPVGTFYLGVDPDNKVNKYYREFGMTVAQIVEQFGFNEETGEIDWTNISTSTRTMFENKQFETVVVCGHLIIPNKFRSKISQYKTDKPYYSAYFELGGTATSAGTNLPQTGTIDDEKLLSESGYDYFPVLAVRWETKGEETYDESSCGIIALGDVMQLQKGESKSLKAIDKMVDPPMVGASSLKNQKSSILPNSVTYVDEASLNSYRPAHEVRYDINAMENKQAQVRDRINKAFFVDLFLMLANSDRRQITATEVQERHEEKMLALGPVLENLNNDLLDPLIDIMFMFMERQGRLPLPPEELQDSELKIEYTSIMAQAQKLVHLSSIERFTTFTTNLAQFDSAAMRKFNTYEAIDSVADIVGVPPKVVNSDKEVQEIERLEAEEARKQRQLDQMQQQAQTNKTMSETDVEGDSALREVLTGV